jgi:hypothetical protein
MMQLRGARAREQEAQGAQEEEARVAGGRSALRTCAWMRAGARARAQQRAHPMANWSMGEL